MKATIVSGPATVNLELKESGAAILTDVFRYSATIGAVISEKEGLIGDEAQERASKIQRTLYRARTALSNAEWLAD